MNKQTTEQIFVSYQDDYGVWKYVEQELLNHLPLRSVTCKTKTGISKVIDKVPISLLPYDDERIQFPSLPMNWYRKPYLYLYFVNCEDNEGYKQLVKSKLKSWVQLMQEKQQEWLIVYISLGHKRFSEALTKLHRTVYDKIRADFNTNKRDRCCQLRMEEVKNEEYWDDFLSKLKEGIVASVDQYISSYEEEIRKMDSKRTLPGWNYCGFFFLKENLAFTYERAQMIEEALMQYDELEALYADDTNPKLERFGGNDPEDENAIFLDTSQKSFRDFLYQNNIAEFDFRQYLFARQCRLLFVLCRPYDVAVRAIPFISNMSVSIKRNKAKLPPNFGDTWVFSACLAVVEACEDARAAAFQEKTLFSSVPSILKPPKSTQYGNPLSASQPLKSYFSATRSSTSIPPPPAVPMANAKIPRSDSTPIFPTSSSSGDLQKLTFDSFDTMIADLIYHARSRLDVLGVDFGLLSGDEQVSTTVVFRNAILSNAMSSTYDFDNYYLDLTQKAIQLYTNVGRRRSVERLSTEIATLHFLRKSYDKAEAIFRVVLVTYHTDGWLDLEYNILTRLAESQRHLGHLSEYCSTCLSLLTPNLPLQQTERIFYANELVAASKSSPSTIVRGMEPVFVCKFEGFEQGENVINSGQKLTISCTINSNFPMELPASKLTLTLICGEKIRESLGQVGNIILNPGSNVFSLSAVFHTVGDYFMDKVSFETSQLLFVNPSLKAAYPGVLFRVVEGIPSLRIEGIQGFPRKKWAKTRSYKPKFRNYKRVITSPIPVFGLNLDCSRATLTIPAKPYCIFTGIIPPPLLLGIPQLVPLNIHSASTEPVEGCVLKFSSSTTLSIMYSLPCKIVRTLVDTPFPVVTANFEGGTLALLPLGPSEKLEVFIPVMASDLSPRIHTLHAELIYKKATTESTIKATIHIPFAHPFIASPLVVTLPNNKESFVQIFARCTAGFPITILGYQLLRSQQRPLCIKFDPNDSIHNMIVLPNHQVSLVFTTEGDISNLLLELKYQVSSNSHEEPSGDMAQPHTVQIPLTLSASVQEYHIETTHPHAAYLGTVIPFELSISRVGSGISNLGNGKSIEDHHNMNGKIEDNNNLENVHQETEVNGNDHNNIKKSNIEIKNFSGINNTNHTVTYEIEAGGMWLVSGRKKASVSFDNDRAQISCKLLPIATGMVPLPRIRVHGVNISSFVTSEPSHIRVFPTSITADCRPAETAGLLRDV